MKSAAQIRMDFRAAMNKADELDELARRMKIIAVRDYSDAMYRLSAAWTGEAASAYQTKGNQLKEKMIQDASELSRIASVIRRVAKRLYDTEMEACMLAKEREY